MDERTTVEEAAGSTAIGGEVLVRLGSQGAEPGQPSLHRRMKRSCGGWVSLGFRAMLLLLHRRRTWGTEEEATLPG